MTSEVRRGRNLVWVEAHCPRHFLVFEKMFMPFSRYWRSELESVIIVENTSVHLNIGMWRDGSDGDKERVVRRDSFVKQIVCFLGKHICDILSLIASRCFSAMLERAVQIIVCVRVEKEVLSQVS